MTTNKKALFIDGNSIINRAFFGLPTLTNSKGMYTNAIYGFLNIFFKLYEEEQPDYIGVAFDLSGPTVRHEQFADYKGHRKGMPDELRVQMPVLKSLLAAMNIQTWGVEGYEADDILGTLSVTCPPLGIDVTLVSGDTDLLQLATDTVKIRIPKTKGGQTTILDYYADDVLAEKGVTPKAFIDVKALMGDSSDNIPGVSGIGEKTAVKLIAEYGTLENALDNHATVKPPRIGEKLHTERDMALLSKQLATIITNAPIDPLGEPLTREQLFNEAFRTELVELEFKTLVAKYFSPDLSTATLSAQLDTNFEYHHIRTMAELDRLFDQLVTQATVALNPVIYRGESVGLSVAFAKDSKTHGYFVPYGDDSFPQEFVAERCLGLAGKTLVAFDSKCLLKHLSLELTVAFDTTLACYLLNQPSSLQDVAQNMLSLQLPTDEALAGKGRNKLSFDQLTPTAQQLYGAGPALVAMATYDSLSQSLDEHNQRNLYYNIELPLAKVLAGMEQVGIKIDRLALINFDRELTDKIDTLTTTIHELAGEAFNINSPNQLGTILFEKLGLKGGKKNKTGYSTAADVLEKLRTEHAIIPHILEYRTLSKLKSTYSEGLLTVADPETDKIHTTFDQVTTATGRLSSVNPNLQNIPIRTEIGRQLRRVFVPTSDSYVFLDADYSQIELRILAHLSGDSTMIDAYKQGIDIHRATAAQVLGLPIEQVSDAQRSSAKAINFGIIYGMGAFSLSVDLGITRKEAEDYIAKYFEQYPSIKAYLDGSVETAKTTGYGETMLGRRRAIPELRSGNFIQKAHGERIAMNMPIQGSAADIIKIAMVKVAHALTTAGLSSRLILTVHDELLVETLKTEQDQVAAILQQEMESAIELAVPLVAEVKAGESWYDTK